MGLWWVWGVRHTDLLLQSFTGIPSIFALMTLLLFLMAERTASRRNPGHLSSFRISLHTQKLRSISSRKLKWMELLRTTQHGKGWPLIVAELLLHQEQVGLQLVPLKDDVPHLLLSETWLVRILPLFCWLTQGNRCCQMRTRLMGQRGSARFTFWNMIFGGLKLNSEAWVQGLWCWFYPVAWSGAQSLWFSPSGRPPCQPSSPRSSSAGPEEHSACGAALCSFSWNAPTAPEATDR